MAEIHPFHAVHYNPGVVADLGKVVTQPYDKISPNMQSRYYESSPFNVVRLILRRPPADSRDNLYREAAGELRQWIDQRVLVSDAQPAIYPYTQEYSLPEDPSIRKRRRGFIALLKLEDYSAGVVYRHEETLSGPKADRMELLKATRCNFGHIFMLYSDTEGAVENLLEEHVQTRPWQQTADEYSTLHSVWRLTDPRAIHQLAQAMQPKKLVIADGHHRYETSLAYRHQRQAEDPEDTRANYIMATFIPLENEGLTILPTHRVVHSLSRFDWSQLTAKIRDFFEVETIAIPGNAGQETGNIRRALERGGRERPTLAAYAGPEHAALLTLRPELDLSRTLAEYPVTLARLDVVLLHALVLERATSIDRQAVREQKNLRYIREMDQAIREVNTGRAQIAFLMNATPIQAVWDNAFAGLVLPQKSTDFYPKLLSGLTFYWMDNPAGL